MNAANQPSNRKRIGFWVAACAVTLLALGLRLYAAARLNVDYDEPVYLSAAISYANYMRAGDLKMLAWNEKTYEHPALYKLLYGVVLLFERPIDRLPDKDLPRLAPIAATAAGPWNMVLRYVSVFWGTLAVLALSLLDPLAGFFMGVNTLSVKYTSEVYLEALPLFSSLVAVLAYDRWYRRISQPAAASGPELWWLLCSAVFLGITLASKYIYGIAALAIGLHFFIALLRKRVSPRYALYLVAWAALSLLVFFAFDPYLWPHPIARLMKSVGFHQAYEQSSWVEHYHYPFWQPFRWLSAFSAFYDLGPASACLVNIDTLIFLLAILGLPQLFRRQPLFFCWLFVGIGFLLLWQTKWPQYALIVLPALSRSAALGVFALGGAAARRFHRPSPASGTP